MIGKSAVHALRVVFRIDLPHTQTTPAEQRALVQYATQKRRAAEIGVYEGANTAQIAAALAPTGILFGIDPFTAGRLGISWGEVIARRYVSASGSEAKVRFVKALSWDALSDIGGMFDFVFVDGDHSLDGIMRDWEDWSKRIEVGGVIVLHDTRASTLNPGVETLGSAQYFESHIKRDARFTLIEQIDTMSILERLPTG